MAKFRVLYQKGDAVRAVEVEAALEDEAKKKAGAPHDGETITQIQKADEKGGFPFTLGVSTLGGPDKLA